MEENSNTIEGGGHMLEYKFVKIKLSYWRRKANEDYRDIINDHASQGWRLVQIFSPSVGGYGLSTYFELIFEKDI